MTIQELTRAACLASLLSLASGCRSNPYSDRPGFESPEAAVGAVVSALRAEEIDQVQTILGPASADLLDSGDEIVDQSGRADFLKLYDERHSVELAGPDDAILYIGDIQWPFPIPMVRSSGTWFLDTEEGREELLDRRVGRNELNTVKVCLALVDAQNEYASRDRDGDGILEYAQAIRSSSGQRDGLYWPTTEDGRLSPIGELLAAAGEKGDLAAKADSGYHGYRFRVLTSQGQHATGGAYDYRAGAHMIGGFGVVAYPLRYGDSGVVSFLVSHHGVVYETDLGPETETLASGMTAFDPDSHWTPTPID